jgi:hypothetical protein
MRLVLQSLDVRSGKNCVDSVCHGAMVVLLHDIFNRPPARPDCPSRVNDACWCILYAGPKSEAFLALA